jgi:iron uptake system component EfeO
MRALIAVTTLALSLTACGGSDATDSAGESSTVAVKAGDTTCEVATRQFTSGDTVLFDVENTGKDVTEVYVYGKGSSDKFDKIVGEVENIAPGTSRDFSVTLGGGEYEVACKPGQKGDGIRTEIEVAGEAEETESTYDHEIKFTAKEFAFTGLAGFTAKAGDKIEFSMTNNGTMQHEFEVFGPDGTAIGEIGPTDAGKVGEVILKLEKAGTYTFKCGIADHAARGMKGSFTVS